MGKRSDFERYDKDKYRTFDRRAYGPIEKFLTPATFYEPCCGQFDMLENLTKLDWLCVGWSDIEEPFEGYKTTTIKDALDLTKEDLREADYIVTNPPWSRHILHPMIEHFVDIAPRTLLLFDADWAYTKQAKPYLRHCSAIFPVGRLKWIPGTNMQGKDNCSWYMFEKEPDGIRFVV